MRLACGAAGQCRTIHKFSCIAWLTSWVGALIAPGEMVPVALTVVVFGSRLRGRVYGQFELDGGAQSVRLVYSVTVSDVAVDFFSNPSLMRVRLMQ